MTRDCCKCDTSFSGGASALRSNSQIQSSVSLWGSVLQDMCCVRVLAEVIFIRTENKSSKEQLKCLIEQTIVESHPAYLPVFGSMSRHRKLSKHPQAKSNQQKEFKTMK